ncbi:hypothetical protein NDU88_001397 [Pleurodeles waltl]|uniref:Uncharacterized protein n=1 Tax=Pleurodeles waltl TaxID=8319 RepID=A0AAV7U6Q7_PLEWA|nr:hypothetical protein NDU88_001397 [Pleurodeles waltl]
MHRVRAPPHTVTLNAAHSGDAAGVLWPLGRGSYLCSRGEDASPRFPSPNKCGVSLTAVTLAARLQQSEKAFPFPTGLAGGSAQRCSAGSTRSLVWVSDNSGGTHYLCATDFHVQTAAGMPIFHQLVVGRQRSSDHAFAPAAMLTTPRHKGC